jgi:hypothetical protein
MDENQTDGAATQQKKEDAARALKKEMAQRFADAASKAEAEAAKAVEVAKRARQRAEAAAADAADMVLVKVPTSFGIHMNKKIVRKVDGQDHTYTSPILVEVKAGTTQLPREVAEHAYAKANGVQILGLPSDALKEAGTSAT